MGFDVIGAATGVQSALGEALKRHILMQESRQRQQQLDQQGENITLNREYQRMNAESLADSRRSQTELRESQIAERQARLDRQKQLQTWAQGVVETTGGQVADPADWQSAFNIARAKNILATGEDLPDTLQSQIISSYMKNPQDKMLSTDEYNQRVQLAGAEADARNKSAQKYPRPQRPSAGSSNVAARRESATAVNNYLGYLMKVSNGNVDEALARFDAAPEDAIRKAGGFQSLPAIRAALASYKTKGSMTPKQNVDNFINQQIYDSLMNGGQQFQQDDDQ